MVLVLFGLMALNFAISWFNAWSVGKVWKERELAGFFGKLVIWSGAVMSACGFIWVYLMIEALVFRAVGWLDDTQVNGLVSLGYLVIILPVLGSGLALTVNAWATAWRKRNFVNMAAASWNTFAQTYNTYRAISAIPDALEGVGDVFSPRRDSKGGTEGAAGAFILLLLLLAVIGGVMTTAVIIRSSARSHAAHVYDKYGLRKEQPVHY